MGRHTEKLPLHERYSARHFDLGDVFIDLDLSDENSVEPLGFTTLALGRSTVFLSSEESKKIKRPNPIVMGYREFNKIGLDNIQNRDIYYIWAFMN